jgi:hypothetical protein
MRRTCSLSFAAALGLCLCALPALATPYWGTDEIARHAVGDQPQVTPDTYHAVLARVLRDADRTDYLAMFGLICSFLDTWQVDRVGDPDYGGIIEGEHMQDIIQTDNTSEAIWMWSRYHELTGDDQYDDNIQAAFVYELNYPAYQEEGDSTPIYGYYRMYNCGWACRAELKYRQVFGDTTYQTYGNTCADYIRDHTLSLPASGFYRRVNPPILSWATGNLYIRGVADDNASWRAGALTHAQTEVKVWVEATPSILGIEEWAMTGGATMWGLVNSYFAEHPSEAPAWIPTYVGNMDTFSAPGSFQNAWNGWYAIGHYAVGTILEDAYHMSVHLALTDTLVAEDGDDDGGIPARPEETDEQDQTWVSNYLGFMGLNGLLPEEGASVPVPIVASNELRILGPNPAYGQTVLSYALPQPGEATLEILDVTGRTIARLNAATNATGWNAVTWRGVDAWQRPVPAGTYFAVLRTSQDSATQRIVWVR